MSWSVWASTTNYHGLDNLNNIYLSQFRGWEIQDQDAGKFNVT
jgi:hypothetical protein